MRRFALMLLAALALAPHASAHSGLTPQEQAIVDQAGGSLSSYACGSDVIATNYFTPEVGKRYLVVFGVANAGAAPSPQPNANIVVDLGGGAYTYADRVDSTGAWTNGGASRPLVHTGTTTITDVGAWGARSFKVAFEWVPTSTATISVGASATSVCLLQGWTLSGTAGLVHTFARSGTTVGFIFDADAGPSAPVLTVAPGVEVATLSWPAVSGASHYSVFRSAASLAGTLPLNATGYTFLGTTTATYYRDTAATVDTANYYRVQAVANGGIESAASNEVFAVPWELSLTGPHGVFYGGNQSGFAESAQINAAAVDFGFSVLTMLFLAGLGYKFGEGRGAAAGGVTGAVVAIAFGWFPVWAAFFLVVVGAGVWVMRRRSSGGG